MKKVFDFNLDLWSYYPMELKKRGFIMEKGRSMPEMLGVLAIMGVLSVVGVAGYRHGITKHRANVTLNDSRMAYMESKTRQSVPDHAWHDISHNFDSGKTFQMLRDKKGNDYVKVMGVDERACRQILKMSVSGKLSFLTENGENKTDCSEENNIVISWDGLGKPTECETVADCGENFAGTCTAQGQCRLCDSATERMNSDGTACECDPEKAVSCTDGGETTWCCGAGLICDTENKGCKAGTGGCQYNFTQQVYTRSSNCSYIISTQEQTRSSNCHYKVRDYVIEGSLHGVEMTQIQGCPTGEYCLISYFDNECTSSINRGDVGASGAEDVYGVCLKRTMNGGTCDVSTVSTAFMDEVQGCPPGEYCLISYFDEECTSSINRGDVGATTPEQVYGVCLKRTMNGGTCDVAEIAEGSLTEVQGCPAGQYCYLKWQGSDCSTAINKGDVTGPMFGACLERTSTNAQCPIK